ncbi:MAG: type II toxin-antitoxin system VapC family toxin [Betaproteobacteria bacterium]|jgi:predicted nucleic acid-binding protein|nr:type II toxin-antitoxin system VapC family toxin [Betaproteobacteria bacterium]MDH5287690.1 type II toxin-antitoxin system VapC family toxin [Betaproteobacteria bacterium]
MPPRRISPAPRAPSTLHVAESPAAYARRPRIVADATVLAAALFREAEHREAVALLAGRALAAPHLLDYELANVALKKLRRERLPREAVEDALDAYRSLAIERHGIDPAAVLALSQRYLLTAYDSAYLWLAERLGAPLATFDAQLARAAREHLAAGTGADDAN